MPNPGSKLIPQVAYLSTAVVELCEGIFTLTYVSPSASSSILVTVISVVSVVLRFVGL